MDENMKELVGTIQELLININSRIDDISNRYKMDGIFQEERIVSLLDDLNALSEGVSVIDRYYTAIDLSELRDNLFLMTEALERKDHSLFIDLMQFEVKDVLEYWKDILTKE